ncbi:MAG: hypothetical protein KF745_03910 [Phycisphaeraceae bacterium]|nr:hypothetical protein [Phycisphaeraceae bacterium]
MSDSAAGSDAGTPPVSAAARRARYAVRAVVLLFAITACCLFVGLIAARLNARLDVTVTREHRLSQRSLDVLSGLDKPYEVVVAADVRSLDPASWQRTVDVLDNFGRASKNLTITRIDTGSADGLARFDGLMKRLAERFREKSAAAVAAVQQGDVSCEQVAEQLDSLSAAILRLREAIPAPPTGPPNAQQYRGYLEATAASCRVSAGDLRKAVQTSRETLLKTAGPLPIPPTDEAVYTVRATVGDAQTLAAQVGDNVARLELDTSLSAEARDQIKPLVSEAASLRDKAGRAGAMLEGVPHPSVLRVVRALEQTAAALVIGPPDASGAGITAIDLAQLVPPRPAPGEPSLPDTRFRAEELIDAAITGLIDQLNPIVVFVHALPTNFAPSYREFSLLVDRLRLRGIDVAEWNVSISPESPALTRLDATGKRPVVYAIVSVPAVAADSARRMGRLADATVRLINAGKPVLLSATPSTLPGIGSPDPMVSFLSQLMVTMDSGRPLLRQTQTPTGRSVGADHIAESAGADHPIARSLVGIRTPLLWPLPITRNNPADGVGDSGITFTPLLKVPASKDVWAESDWMDYATVWPSQPATGSPAPDSSRDATSTEDWVVAAAVERLLPNSKSPQRLVLVGSYRWYSDQLAVLIGDKRADPADVFRLVGNLELFEAATLWLAGQDERISQSPTAQSVPLIPTMSAQRVTVIRWMLIAGLPALVLLAGAAWRVLRG